MINESATRDILEHALTTQQPEFGQFFLAKLLQLDINYEDEVCHVGLPVAAHLYNPQGSLHGGIIAVAMDISMGHLIHHVTGKGGSTIEMKVQFLRPIMEGTLRFEGRFVKRGRQLAFMQSQAFNAEGKEVAIATATWMMPSNG
ncbi:MAG: PaaI family thioesterase [Gammaproteobacteria bacterium]|nr:PaaI family thioesterase [Gammaproteobacteria bacterium]